MKQFVPTARNQRIRIWDRESRLRVRNQRVASGLESKDLDSGLKASGSNPKASSLEHQAAGMKKRTFSQP